MTLYFTKEHEWLRVEGDVATVGITKHAAEELGEIVFFELNTSAPEVKQGDSIAVVESVKAASDVYAPVDGVVTEGNPSLANNPELISSDPEGEGWMMKLKLTNTAQLSELMDDAAYHALIS
ncbi:glycine cleavage system protein GcvH [Acetobacter oeni]|uniref:Glycine cleavage system H protein n=1 Tax=Acetobacter oeni TaxID=304077 RepID=A0A511XGX2_9PROT|nr:glycine cleavage system protein GcvH [Acetobacter oeni]MBB3882333.1 glycine cleavage system H protein [Acetobacter oeni]NHO18562.1 glycine cleavage system protein GcvH [Acetobacter oeni]GBR02249.1 glycine cleavage system H protein [Acetobacter oeni LMG 21952]GEN62196.1 glycine cleavage system H protein [Acetobacter oeni]